MFICLHESVQNMKKIVKINTYRSVIPLGNYFKLMVSQPVN